MDASSSTFAPALTIGWRAAGRPMPKRLCETCWWTFRAHSSWARWTQCTRKTRWTMARPSSWPSPSIARRAQRTSTLQARQASYILCRVTTVPCMARSPSVMVCAGTGPEVFANTNAPPAVTSSAIIYSLRCLVPQEIPLNQAGGKCPCQYGNHADQPAPVTGPAGET